MMKWLTGLATIAAVAWFPSVTDDADTLPPTALSASTEEPQPPTKPSIGGNREFSVAEIRWCMSEDIRLQTMEPSLATRSAIDRYNELADDYNRRCNSYKASNSQREEARREVDGRRQLVVSAAREEIRQLNDAEASIGRTQELLDLLGYDPGEIDGVYGTQTTAAIEAFQRKAGLSVDGLVSRELLDRLRFENARRLAGRSRREKTAPTADTAVLADIVVLVTEPTEVAVSGAQVSISSAAGFHADRVTNELGKAKFGAVPPGKLDIDVQRNADRSRFTLQVTEEPHQEVLIILPTQQLQL